MNEGAGGDDHQPGRPQLSGRDDGVRLGNGERQDEPLSRPGTPDATGVGTFRERRPDNSVGLNFEELMREDPLEEELIT